MNKPLDQSCKGESTQKPKARVGAKEVLTQDLARRIALMVGQFPDSNIAVTWDNVVRQTKLRFRNEFRRNVLSQKAWGGRKLIADAFQDAKEIQRRQTRDTAPKYVNEPRSRLRLLVAKLQSENLALRERLSRVRAQRYDEIHSLLDTRTPLSRLEDDMSKPFDQPRKGESGRKPKGQAGAKEVLTQDLARRIALMIGQFPDSDIDVTWDNVVRQTKLRFRHEFRRNVLSQKAWDGRRLIAEAFQDAKEIQRREARDRAPKCTNEPRSRLRLLVVKLQSENLALREQLAGVRARQYDEIHSLLDTRTPLNRLVAMRSELSVAPTYAPQTTADRETVASIEKVKASRDRKEERHD